MRSKRCETCAWWDKDYDPLACLGDDEGFCVGELSPWCGMATGSDDQCLVWTAKEGGDETDPD